MPPPSPVSFTRTGFDWIIMRIAALHDCRCRRRSNSSGPSARSFGQTRFPSRHAQFLLARRPFPRTLFGFFFPKPRPKKTSKRRPSYSHRCSTRKTRWPDPSYSGSPSSGSWPCCSWYATYYSRWQRDARHIYCHWWCPTGLRWASSTENGQVSWDVNEQY